MRVVIGTHSEFENLRAGRRYASHGQTLPGDAPPQSRRNYVQLHSARMGGRPRSSTNRPR